MARGDTPLRGIRALHLSLQTWPLKATRHALETHKRKSLNTLAAAFFTLGLSTACSDDPVVQEMEDWADAACACEDLDCVSKAADDLVKKGTEMGDKQVTQGEMDKIEASIERATKCITDGQGKFVAN